MKSDQNDVTANIVRSKQKVAKWLLSRCNLLSYSDVQQHSVKVSVQK